MNNPGRVTTVALEYRPALFQAFGIGRYVRNLAPAMLEADPALELVLFSVFLRGHAARARDHDWPRARARRVGVRFPGRAVPLLGRLGYTFDRRLEPFDLFHHTDYALTPLRTRRRVVTLYDTAWLPHRGYVEPSQARKMERAVRGLLRGDPEVITLSETARAELVDHFRIDPDRAHVTPLAADPVFATPLGGDAIEEAQRRLDIRRPYVICLGTLEPRKNVVQLVRAVQEARRKIADLELVLLGRKGFRHEGVFEEGESRLGAGLRWLGSVPDRDAAALVQGAAALVFPSLYEGFGLPAIEGMAAGVPVIASDIPVMREICGTAAMLVDTTRTDVLTEAIRWAVEGRATQLAQRGRLRAAEFTWHACATATLGAYRRLLERTR
jgi:glycosyltransferase involved in cell wall biosynthesis